MRLGIRLGVYAAIPLVLAASLTRLARAADTPKFDMTGTVHTGIMAIGGETTGMTLTTDGGTFELTGTPAIVKQIEALDGKKAHVTGTLTVKAGVEMGERKIVTVEVIEGVK